MEVDESYQKMLEQLREHCEREKMSIYALAKNTNLSTSSLSNLLNGKTKPYVYTLLLICDALSISITDLADKDVSMTEDEKWIISSYRSLSTKKKEMLTTYIKMLSQYEEKMQTMYLFRNVQFGISKGHDANIVVNYIYEKQVTLE